MLSGGNGVGKDFFSACFTCVQLLYDHIIKSTIDASVKYKRSK